MRYGFDAAALNDRGPAVPQPGSNRKQPQYKAGRQQAVDDRAAE
jgi:hypothetical protein